MHDPRDKLRRRRTLPAAVFWPDSRLLCWRNKPAAFGTHDAQSIEPPRLGTSDRRSTPGLERSRASQAVRRRGLSRARRVISVLARSWLRKGTSQTADRHPARTAALRISPVVEIGGDYNIASLGLLAVDGCREKHPSTQARPFCLCQFTTTASTLSMCHSSKPPRLPGEGAGTRGVEPRYLARRKAAG